MELSLRDVSTPLFPIKTTKTPISNTRHDYQVCMARCANSNLKSRFSYLKLIIILKGYYLGPCDFPNLGEKKTKVAHPNVMCIF